MKILRRLSMAGVVSVAVGVAVMGNAPAARAANIAGLNPLNLGVFANPGVVAENPFLDPLFVGTYTVDGAVRTWELDAPYVKSGYTINNLKVTLDSDPQVLFSFAVTAGNTNTTFTFSSDVVSFGAITNPSASASAAITLTDNNGDGASLMGKYAGNTSSYRADTNLGNYAYLVPNLTAGAFSTANGNGSLNTPIAGNVTDMSTEFKFVVTRLDSASGTSNFTIVPEPASIIGLAAGFVGLLSMRRRSS